MNVYHTIAYWVIKNLSRTRQGKIYIQALLSLGEDVSPQYDELGCAESVNTIVERATGKPVGGNASTYYMYNALKKGWKEVKTPEPGDIVISPTGHGHSSNMSGHVGIVSVNNKIISNNSANSLMEENYTLNSWKKRYVTGGGFPMKYFR